MKDTMTRAEFYEELIQMYFDKYTLDNRMKMMELQRLIEDIESELYNNRIFGDEALKVLERAYNLISDRLFDDRAF